MKKILFFGAIFCFQSIFSQVTMAGNKLVKDGQSYKFSQYQQVFTNPVASDYFKQGRSNKTAGDVISSIGGFGMGLSLGLILSTPKEQSVSTPFGSATVETDNSARWTVFGLSAGIALVSIPFYVGAKKNFNKAIETENGESTAFEPYFKLESAGNGLALSYHF
ncbi:hypothetical protein Q73A0000_11950 [Kaistella flava (ex Peng et al. 2021)]|uniref:Outer membrane protein beta-barrel domain-containing protein n=1 Tax=Kaistella flava (ex Peng et al. 2021) TaxID=2038776 RepID=A0A7M2YC48_9FLAO|nr:hypothetical protein [Kaistella flava (ex Peng et al. 2021)]QOW11022.1 hypothetical protein Q73A0000_11950 [Kaistella flava (ex Peng et al. 2021)]